MINAIGTGCGFFCNLFMGSINQATHSYPLTMLPIVGFAAVASLVLLVIGRPQHAAVPAAAQ
jgi:nitrate/nitrite transporter NarK